MKALHRLFVYTLFLSLFSVGLAEPLNVFFGTGGRGAEGIYHATFNPDNGRFFTGHAGSQDRFAWFSCPTP